AVSPTVNLEPATPVIITLSLHDALPIYQHAVRVDGHGALDELLAGQAFAHAERTHFRQPAAVRRIDPEQAAPRRKPQPAPRVHAHAGGLGGGDAVAHAQPQLAVPASVLALPQFQARQALQPEAVDAVQHEPVDGVAFGRLQ